MRVMVEPGRGSNPVGPLISRNLQILRNAQNAQNASLSPHAALPHPQENGLNPIMIASPALDEGL
jgi:hypothetical protein